MAAPGAEAVRTRRTLWLAARTLWLAALASLAALMVWPEASTALTRGPRLRVAQAETGGATLSRPAATAVTIESTRAQTRIAFALTAAVPALGFVMADPDRVIIDLPETDFRLDSSAGRSKPSVRRGRGRTAKPEPLAPLVGSFRFGLFAPGKSRIVIDLTGPVRIVRVATETAAAGPRLVIELAATDRASFIAAARRPEHPAAAAEASPPPAAAPDAMPLIVLDPGHGGVDSGAHAANGALEKDVVFEFSKELMAKLEAQGRYRVKMTRSSDIFVPLAERVRIARNAGAALFVSIHADTLDEPGVSGATVYTVAEKASDAQAAKVAEKENEADAAGGLEGRDDQSDVNDILFDLTRRETRVYSHAFARTLVGYVREVARLNKNPHRSAGFRVLRAPDVPSVLLELGYLSSGKDLANLVAADWRDRTASAVTKAIDQFFRNASAKPQETAPALRRSISAEEPGHVAAKQR